MGCRIQLGRVVGARGTIRLRGCVLQWNAIWHVCGNVATGRLYLTLGPGSCWQRRVRGGNVQPPVWRRS